LGGKKQNLTETSRWTLGEVSTHAVGITCHENGNCATVRLQNDLAEGCKGMKLEVTFS
jgi:hypothetical protein